jgi:hypothetical protein
MLTFGRTQASDRQSNAARKGLKDEAEEREQAAIVPFNSVNSHSREDWWVFDHRDCFMAEELVTTLFQCAAALPSPNRGIASRSSQRL